MSTIRLLLAIALAVAMLPAGALAQERGTITGQVVDQATGQPLQGVQISIAGLNIGTLTNQQGRFLIPNVPTGPREVRAMLIGYGQVTQPVNVAGGQTATVELRMGQVAIALDEVIVNAVTGQSERRRESGNVVNTIRADQIETAAVANVSQMLTARAPGVVIQQHGGTTGGSQRIRIRGSNSISLSNQPLLIVDGVRVNNSPAGLGSVGANNVWVGGQETSRWNDFSPDEIENIEIIKGPAAAALYGTAAANGVIQITTRRGRAGRPQWSAYTEYGTLNLDQQFPANYRQVGRSPTDTRVASCTLDARARGQCTPVADSLLSFNPLMTYSPFRDGYRQQQGLNVAGGTEQVTYYIGGDFEREQGVLDPNSLRKVNLRANLQSRIAENLTAAVTTGYIANRTMLAWNDNSSFGAMGAGLLGQAVDDTVRQGYFSRHPSHFFFIDSGQDVYRFTGGLNLTWQPVQWMNVVGQAGIDQANRHDFQLTAPGISNYSTGVLEGSRYSNRFTLNNYTANLSGTSTFQLRPDLQSQTTIGAAYTQEGQHATYGFGRQLLIGTGTLGGAAAGFAVSEDVQDIVTVGAYARQQLAWRDRVFVTAALRGDDNSAFGTDFGLVLYPAFSASWVVSEEPFFPQVGFLSQLRLRGAYGQSGQRPGFRQAETYFNPVSVALADREVTAVTLGGSGNALLSPERSSEVEAGFELGLLANRVGLEVTYYNKTTQDALIARRLAPSLGATTTRFDNIGRVNNRGFEALLNASLVERGPVHWDVTLTASTNRNRLLELGEGIEPIIFNSVAAQRHQDGLPLGAFYQRRILSYEDRNGDGIISRVNCPTYGTTENPQIAGGPECEVVLSQSEEFLGTPLPTREIGFNTRITLLNWLRVSGQLDYKGGQTQYNYTEWFRCANWGNCEATHNANAPLDEQARYIAALMGTPAGYIEDASFVKLREVAFTLTAPQDWSRRLGGSGLSLTVAGRNLATWTNYTGFDPEVNSLGYTGPGNAGGDFYMQDFLTMPPVRYWTARVNYNF
ncbi:MAG: SusC/RagA family TonB-linked outer membrane protein [Longimicrobiaceae bacterium]